MIQETLFRSPSCVIKYIKIRIASNNVRNRFKNNYAAYYSILLFNLDCYRLCTWLNYRLTYVIYNNITLLFFGKVTLCSIVFAIHLSVFLIIFKIKFIKKTFSLKMSRTCKKTIKN